MPQLAALEHSRVSVCYWGQNCRPSSVLSLSLLFSLVPWKIRIRLDFFNLFCVSLTVRCDKQDEFIPIHFAHRSIHHVIPQAGCVLEVLFCRNTALEKMLGRLLWRTETIAGLEWLRSLRFAGSVGNHRQHRFVDLYHITIRLARR